MTSTEAPTVETIDAPFIRALRHADSIVFRLHAGQGSIEAHQRAESSLTGFDQRIGVNVASHVKDYGANYTYQDANGYNAFHMEHSMSVNDDARTLVARIRKGDTLALAWTRNNQTETLNAAGLVADELHLTITHSSGSREHYLVAYAVTRDNSARMVRLA